MFMKDIGFASYTDDNIPYIISDDMNQVVSNLEYSGVNLFKWFSDNQMKPNTEKCHVQINKDCQKKINIANNITWSSKCKRLL